MTPATTKTALIPLTQACPGQCVRVQAVDGGQALRARLCALGLAPGMSVEMVSVGSGPVILRVMGSRLVLGHGMAAKVMVRVVRASSK